MDNKQKAGIALGVGAGILALTQLVGGGSEENPENIELSDLVIDPSECEVGDEVIISCIATNNGGEKATRIVDLEVT